MICDLCNKLKPSGVLMDDIAMCDTCACKLVDIGELDVRDFGNAVRI